MKWISGGGLLITYKRKELKTMKKFTNLIAVCLLSRYGFRLLQDYKEQHRKGTQEPVFHKDLFPDADIEGWE